MKKSFLVASHTWWLPALVLGLVVLWYRPVMAQHVGPTLTEQDIVLLPEYCRYAQSINEKFGNREGQESWYARLGKDFSHIHHYCWALVAIQRSQRASERHNRGGHLNNAVLDCNYVVTQSRPDFVLLPDVLVARAKALGGLGKEKEALGDFKKAQQLAPARISVYVEWATYHVSKGQPAEARQVVEEGLRQNPNSTTLTALAKSLRK